MPRPPVLALILSSAAFAADVNETLLAKPEVAEPIDGPVLTALAEWLAARKVP